MSFDPNTEDFEKAYWWDEDTDNTPLRKAAYLEAESISYAKKEKHFEIKNCEDCGLPIKDDKNKKVCGDCSYKRQNQAKIEYMKKKRLEKKREKILHTHSQRTRTETPHSLRMAT